MNLSEQITERLKLLRNEQRRTMEQVTAATNMTMITYVKYKAGSANPVFKSLYALAEFYQVSLDYIACRTADRRVHRL